MMASRDSSQKTEELRQQAEAVPREESSAQAVLDERDVYQAELELQNQELRRIQQQLTSTLQKQRALFEGLPNAALVVDPHAVVHEANPMAIAMFGVRSLAMFQGHSLLRLVAQDQRGRLMDLLKSVMATGRNRALPRLQLNNGNDAEADVHASLLPDAYHLERRILLSLEDRTEHYGRQRQMNLLGTMLDHLGSEVIAFDRGGYLLYANRNVERATGRSQDELLGSTRTELLRSGQDVAAEEADHALVLMTKAPVRKMRNWETPDGNERHFETLKFPVFDSDLNCVAVGEVVTDRTAERVQQKSLDMVMQAYGISRDAIVMTDADNKIVSVNRAFEEITGYEEREVIGQNPSILQSGRHDKAFFKAMWRDILAGGWDGEIWNRRKTGEVYPEWLTISPIRGAGGSISSYIAVFRDITQRKATEDELAQLAFYDVLTGLANRQLLADRARQALHASARDGSHFALVYFDLDHFKQINDVHGHEIGDGLLKAVAARVQRFIRDKDTLSRIGGDEFVLLLTGIEAPGIESRLQTLLSQLNEPYSINGIELDTSASFGVAVYPDDGDDYDVLLKHADNAMYLAKEAGRNTVRFFSSKAAAHNQARIRLEGALHRAVGNRELSLVYQPQVALADRRVVACEALLRWSSAKLGEQPPTQFIPAAERTGVIREIGAWVMQNALAFAARLQQSPDAPRIAINLSARQLRADDFIETVEAELARQGADPSGIELELTETTLMQESEEATRLLGRLKALGFAIAIDDFGTGYSSLSYLNNLPVDRLKIDRSFVSKIGQGEKHDQLCRTIVSLADSLDIGVVAEGVETEAQYDFLVEAGCEVAQGFYIARPMSQAKLVSSLSAGNRPLLFEVN